MAGENDNKQYVVGRGRLYFDKFLPGTKTPTGLRYLGNTPELSITRARTSLDHFDSDHGTKIKDDSVDLEDDISGAFTTDNISIMNVGMWLGGEVDIETQVSALAVVYPINDAQRGRAYQIGATDANPAGVNNIATVIVKKALVVIAAAGNYEVDTASGMIEFLETAPGFADGDDLTITYDTLVATRAIAVDGAESVYGELRFVADNPKGPQTDYIWPYVKLSPDGDLNLKGDDWQVQSFNYEVLQKSSISKRVISVRRTV